MAKKQSKYGYFAIEKFQYILVCESTSSNADILLKLSKHLWRVKLLLLFLLKMDIRYLSNIARVSYYKFYL